MFVLMLGRRHRCCRNIILRLVSHLLSDGLCGGRYECLFQKVAKHQASIERKFTAVLAWMCLPVARF